VAAPCRLTQADSFFRSGGKSDPQPCKRSDVEVIETSRNLRVAACYKSGSSPKFVCLTANDDQDFVNAAFSTRALGEVLKCTASEDLIPAIHQSVECMQFVSPSLFDMTCRPYQLQRCLMLRRFGFVAVPGGELASNSSRRFDLPLRNTHAF